MARFSPTLATFIVEEIPAYVPCGSGDHTYLWIEKRGLTTFDAIAEIARALGVASRDIGYAGMKDRHAVTRQWISVPRVAPERAMGAVAGETLRVLEARCHGNKLRVGHVRGNRFEVVIDIADDPGAEARLRARLAELVKSGLPNRFGHQRFGREANNAARGRAILLGEARERDVRRRRLWLSSLQSTVFNEVLAARQRAGQLRTVLHGDVLQRIESGGTFVCEDPQTDQARVDAGELVITGPLPGSWARDATENTAARVFEDEALSRLEIRREDFAKMGRELPGTRRPLWVAISDDGLRAEGPSTLRLTFALPAGSYATVLIDELGIDQIDQSDLADKRRTGPSSPTEPAEST